MGHIILSEQAALSSLASLMGIFLERESGPGWCIIVDQIRPGKIASGAGE